MLNQYSIYGTYDFHFQILVVDFCHLPITFASFWVFINALGRSFFLSIFTGSLIHEHYTRECEFGNFDKIKNKKHKKTKQHKKNTKTFG